MRATFRLHPVAIALVGVAFLVLRCRGDDVATIERATASVLKVDAHVLGSDGKQTAVDVGTGFVVHPAGFVVTCHHVVRRSSRGLMQAANGQIAKFSVFARLPQYDLAILQTDPSMTPTALRLRIPSTYRPGERAFTVSNLLARGLAVTQGAIAATNYRLFSDAVIADGAVLLDMTLARGSSGAPVLDNNSRLIGYLVSRLDEKLSLSDVLTGNHLLRAFEELVNLPRCRGLAPGLRVEQSAAGVTVAAVEAAGLEKEVHVGDRITQVEDWAVESLVDYHLSTLAWAGRGGKTSFRVTVVGSDQAGSRTVTIPVGPKVAKALNGVPGRQGATITVSTLAAEKEAAPRTVLTGQVQSLDLLLGLSGSRPCQVAYRAELGVPEEGSYTFYLACPGTGRLEVGSSLVIEKKFDHAVMMVAGKAWLGAGLHRLHLVLQGKGLAERPPVLVEGPGMPSFRPLPDDWLHVPAEPAERGVAGLRID